MKEFEHLKGKKTKVFNDLPKGYFKALKQEVMEKIDQPLEEENPLRRKRLLMAAAALVILMLGIGAALIYFIEPSQPQYADKHSEAPLPNEETLVSQGNGTPINTLMETDHVSKSGADTLSWDDIATEDLLRYLLENEDNNF